MFHPVLKRSLSIHLYYITYPVDILNNDADILLGMILMFMQETGL